MRSGLVCGCRGMVDWFGDSGLRVSEARGEGK